MIRILRYFLLLTTLCLTTETLLAQVQNYKELHKVKRKETIFGIARENGVTVQDLIKANPEMNMPGYELKKGDYIKIPFPSATTAAPVSTAATDKGKSAWASCCRCITSMATASAWWSTIVAC